MAQSKKIKVERRSAELRSELASRLREVMKLENLNQSEIAERAGLKVSYVNRVLREIANMTLESIARLEVALDVALIARATGTRRMGQPQETKLEMNIEAIGSNASTLEELEKVNIQSK